MDVVDYQLKQRMEKRGTPWTRENYIRARWLGELPEEWDESELPEDLQDWSAPAPQ